MRYKNRRSAFSWLVMQFLGLGKQMMIWEMLGGMVTGKFVYHAVILDDVDGGAWGKNGDLRGLFGSEFPGTHFYQSP